MTRSVFVSGVVALGFVALGVFSLGCGTVKLSDQMIQQDSTAIAFRVQRVSTYQKPGDDATWYQLVPVGQPSTVYEGKVVREMSFRLPHGGNQYVELQNKLLPTVREGDEVLVRIIGTTIISVQRTMPHST